MDFLVVSMLAWMMVEHESVEPLVGKGVREISYDREKGWHEWFGV